MLLSEGYWTLVSSVIVVFFGSNAVCALYHDDLFFVCMWQIQGAGMQRWILSQYCCWWSYFLLSVLQAVRMLQWKPVLCGGDRSLFLFSCIVYISHQAQFVFIYALISSINVCISSCWSFLCIFIQLLDFSLWVSASKIRASHGRDGQCVTVGSAEECQTGELTGQEDAILWEVLNSVLKIFHDLQKWSSPGVELI